MRAILGEETWKSLDNILPAQFFDRSRARTPEARLQLAVLEDAIHILTTYPTATIQTGGLRQKRYTTLHETRAWILDDDMTWPCSFRAVCANLDLDADAVRTGLARQGYLHRPVWKG